MGRLDHCCTLIWWSVGKVGCQRTWNLRCSQQSSCWASPASWIGRQILLVHISCHIDGLACCSPCPARHRLTCLSRTSRWACWGRFRTKTSPRRWTRAEIHLGPRPQRTAPTHPFPPWCPLAAVSRPVLLYDHREGDRRRRRCRRRREREMKDTPSCCRGC